VDLSRDLSIAKVCFSLLDPDGDPETALEGLRRAAGFLRSKLGSVIKVRHVPELRFVHDDSAAESVRIGKLIDRALSSDEPR
jgi:ribosome-binding factor A